jgi:hypothetical protein
MHKAIAIAALLPLLMIVTPAVAVTNAEKAETCKFGADDQKLTGAKRKAFIANCMANRNDKRGPKTASVKKRKPAAKPAAAPAPDAAPAQSDQKM